MLIKEFGEYLSFNKKKTKNTVLAYESDLRDFEKFMQAAGIQDFASVTPLEIHQFMDGVKQNGKSATTIRRKLASVRAFYDYLELANKVSGNPAKKVKAPKDDRKKLEYLSVDEVNRLLESQAEDTKGLRNRAALEVLYGTGIKASEMIMLDLDDVNLKMGYMSCDKNSAHARIVPLGEMAKSAIDRYLQEARPVFSRGKDEDPALFLNYQGGRLSRQGLWKILKECGERAKLGQKLNPNTLRNSFAIHMLQNGADLKSLQEIMGYEDISATQGYLSEVKVRIRDVYMKSHPRAEKEK